MKSFKHFSRIPPALSLTFSVGVARNWRLLTQLLVVLIISDLLVITPAVWAQGSLSLLQAWALGVLGLVAVGLSIYLFMVIFQPERF
ncbi:MAG: K(+)-transporting ATPase subunit F [Synechococcaceae cyanobacterium RM1_1_27]|nr:K(+)-transporting ATPase subunit F [Synechococcaceae cyanobacterium SM2_3_2]NJO86280.1 K(+)-transporting ATPase subunit F [Synechococcaceae cyanobacterium RM1_1_27]